MTSASKIAANKKNALRSTGPRSPMGKLRSCRNAFRHGLSIPIIKDASSAAEVAAIANTLSEHTGGPRDAAQLAAEALLELKRIELATNKAIDQQRNSGAYDGLSDEAITSLAVAETMPTLNSFERYRRQADSHLNKALRKLEKAPANPAKALMKSKSKREASFFETMLSEARTADKLAKKQIRLSEESMKYSRQMLYYIMHRKRKRKKTPVERRAKIIEGMAGVARKFLHLNMPDAAIERLKFTLEFAPDDLLLQAVLSCALLINGDRSAREILMRYRGQIDNGNRWEDIVRGQLGQLRKAPGMRAQILGEVERLFEPPEPLSIVIVKGPHIRKNTEAAMKLMLAREFAAALETIDLALPEMPRSVDLNVMRAHALMFLDRTDEARALYEEFRDMRNFMSLSGIELAANQFEMLRAAEFTHPLMEEIKKLG